MSNWNDVGGNPAPGDPVQIRSVANHFRELSDSARYARTQLAALQRGELRACWTGDAADAFAAELELLPADLGKLERSLDHASTAVYSWASTVDNAQQRAESDLRNHRYASQRLDVARDNYERELANAVAEGITNPVGKLIDLASGNNPLEPYQRELDDAKYEVRRVERSIDEVRDDIDAAARRVAYLLEEASRLGIANKTFWQKAGEFLKELGEVLVAALRFLDELVDLIAPWVGIALLLLSFVNPAFALVALAFASLDFGLTASRALLGDETVTARDLFDDGVDLALALVGAKGANAGLGLVDDFGRAANEGSKLARAADATLDVIGTTKTLADAGFAVWDIAGGDSPGSTFDFVVDVIGGDTDGWGEGAYGQDLLDAADNLDAEYGDLRDLFYGGEPRTGIDELTLPEPPPDGGMEPPPGIEPPGGGMEPPPGVEPPPGIEPPGGGMEPPPGIEPPGGGIGTPDVPGAGLPTADLPTTVGVPATDFDPAVLVADSVGPTDAPATPPLHPDSIDAGGVSLVADAAPVAPTDTVAATEPAGLSATEVPPGGDASAGSAARFGAAAGAAALGLAATAAGAKRLSDRRDGETPDGEQRDGDTADDSAHQAEAITAPVAVVDDENPQSFIGTSEYVLSDIVESPAVEVARLDQPVLAETLDHTAVLIEPTESSEDE